MVHGDDFISSGCTQGLKLLEERLGKRFEIKTSIVGTGVDQVKEARVLNRVIRITEHGWEYEPDQRHAELIIEDMGMKEANPVNTPGEDDKSWEEEEEEEENAR